MTRLSDVMTHDVVVFDTDTSLLDAVETLAERHISGAPVMSGNALVGVISTSDILEFIAGNPAMVADFGDDDGDRGNLAAHTVAEAMNGGHVATLPPTAPIRAAAELMRTSGIHRVFIAEEGRVIGVVTSLDITRALADGKVTTRTFVFPSKTHFD
jgi:CBS domain-containing protein